MGRQAPIDPDAIVLRGATTEDTAAILRLQEAAFPGEEQLMTAQGFPDVLAEAGTSLVLAEYQERIAGYCLVRQRATRPWASVDFICIDSDFTGQGLGARLMRDGFTRSQRPIFRLFVRPSNTRALALYKCLGFWKAGRRKANYGDGEDAIILMKWLGLRRRKPGQPPFQTAKIEKNGIFS